MRSARRGLIGIVFLSFASAALAQDASATQSADAAFETSIERRAGETVAEMKLDDAAKAARVKELFKQQFRDIETFDVAHGAERTDLAAELKKTPDDAALAAKLDALVAPLLKTQAAFFDKVGAELTPDQVEQIKNRLVGGRYQHNIDGYKVEFPDLPADAWQHVVGMWQQAREEAMPLGNAKVKDAVFSKWKGRVNIWLSKQGFVGKSAAAKKAKAASQAAQ